MGNVLNQQDQRPQGFPDKPSQDLVHRPNSNAPVIPLQDLSALFALFGGWIWSTLGIETLFIVSAVLGLCNSAYAATIKVPKKAVVSLRTNHRAH